MDADSCHCRRWRGDNLRQQDAAPGPGQLEQWPASGVSAALRPASDTTAGHRPSSDKRCENSGASGRAVRRDESMKTIRTCTRAHAYMYGRRKRLSTGERRKMQDVTRKKKKEKEKPSRCWERAKYLITPLHYSIATTMLLLLSQCVDMRAYGWSTEVQTDNFVRVREPFTICDVWGSKIHHRCHARTSY